MEKTILFDLDGTLTDSGEGIINCAILALEHFGLPIPSREEMRVFVGPPFTSPLSATAFPPTGLRKRWKSTAAAMFPSAPTKIPPTPVSASCWST